MIDISGHLRDIKRDLGFEDNKTELLINCCGYQYFDNMDFSKNRPCGRFDYQIIYLYKGSANFYLKGDLRLLQSGTIILYKPQQHQYYQYLAKYHPQAYWIHFTGSKVESLLQQYDLHNTESFTVGEHMNLCSVFKNIMIELQLKNLNFQAICNNYFMVLLNTIQRLKYEQESNVGQGYNIDNLILQLNLSYNHNWSVEEMAKFCNMSPSRFAHVFKDRKNISAKKFLLNLRLNKAKDLMLNSQLSVTQVATLIGFDDALYFSRIFKKEVGLSPRQFVKIKG